jgi:hypothetical protein
MDSDRVGFNSSLGIGISSTLYIRVLTSTKSKLARCFQWCMKDNDHLLFFHQFELNSKHMVN